MTIHRIHIKKLAAIILAVMAVAVMAVPAYAQGDDPADGERPLAACREAIQTMREAGEVVTRDNLPEACDALTPNLPLVSEACRTAVQDLRAAGEVVTRDNLPEACVENLPDRPRFNGQRGGGLGEGPSAGQNS